MILEREPIGIKNIRAESFNDFTALLHDTRVSKITAKPDGCFVPAVENDESPNAMGSYHFSSCFTADTPNGKIEFNKLLATREGARLIYNDNPFNGKPSILGMRTYATIDKYLAALGEIFPDVKLIHPLGNQGEKKRDSFESEILKYKLKPFPIVDF